MPTLKKAAACLLLICLLLPMAAWATEPETQNPQTIGVCQVASADARDKLVRSLTRTAFYSVSDAGILPGLGALPEDVTKEFAGSYGIPEDSPRGYAFRIAINPVYREDGSAIEAKEVYEVLADALEDDLVTLDIALWNQYRSGTPTPEGEIKTLAEGGYSGIEEAEADGIRDFYVDTDVFWGLNYGWVSIQDTGRLEDIAIPAGVNERFLSGAYLYDRYLSSAGSQRRHQTQFIGYREETGKALTLSDTGLICENGSLVIILAEPAAPATVALALKDLVLEGSYGPYRVTREEGSTVWLERTRNGSEENLKILRITAAA